ncbi:hypothetical protein JCM1841_006472 [Sporobolomyces salmonicolor]
MAFATPPPDLFDSPPSSPRLLSLGVNSTRTPRGGPRYDRSPSGSPLSELAPSPQKPLAAPRTPRSASWRPHTFVLVVPERKGWPARRKKRAMPSSGWMRSERERQRAQDRDGNENEDMEGSSGSSEPGGDDQAGGDEQHSAPRGSSPSSARPGSSSRRKTTGRGHESSSPDRRSRRRSRTASASGSDDSTSDSSATTTVSESDADSYDSGADLFAALSRAKERRAAGEELAIVSPPSGPATAHTTVSPPVVGEGEGRRSTRKRKATDHYSPTKTNTTTTAAATNGNGKGKAKERARPEQEGKHSFNRLMRERQAQEKRGRGTEWWEKMKRNMDDSEDDLDISSDSSEDDDDLPSALSLGTSSAALNTLAAGLTGFPLALDDDDLPSPDKLAGKKRAREMADLLGDEARNRTEGGIAGETESEREGRRVWGDGKLGVEKLTGEEWVGTAWRGRVAEAMRDGLKNPSRFPSPVALFSPLNPDGLGSQEDHRVVSCWLLSLICHPSTSSTLAGRALNLLHRIALHTARDSSVPVSSPLVSAADLVSQLIKLGAKAEKFEGGETPMQLNGVEAETKGASLSVGERNDCVGRLCRVVQALSGTKPRLLNDEDVVKVVVYCVQLALDPMSAVLRGSLEKTLQMLLDSIPREGHATHHRIFQHLITLYRPSRPRVQVEVLRTLPHQSPPNKLLRKWVDWGFMATNTEVQAVVSDPTAFSTPLLPRLLTLLRAPPPSSAFHGPKSSTDASNDVKLFEQATLLIMALSDIEAEITPLDGAGAVDARKTLDDLIACIGHIQSRYRADARKSLAVERLRAKNLLTLLGNSLEYQLRRACGLKNSVDFADEENGLTVKKLKVSDEGEARDGMRQTTLAFTRD